MSLSLNHVGYCCWYVVLWTWYHPHISGCVRYCKHRVKLVSVSSLGLLQELVRCPPSCCFSGTFLGMLHNKSVGAKNVKGTGAWDRNLSDAWIRHAVVFPHGDITVLFASPGFLLSGLCQRVYWSCLAQSPGSARLCRLSAWLFLKWLEFNQNI